MESGTRIVPISTDVLQSPALRNRLTIRQMSAEEWVESHGSGTLRKNRRIGFSWRKQYLQERTAYEFGWPFQCVPRTRVTWGDAISEGDCHPITEAGWHMERMVALWPYPEDLFEVKYIVLDTEGMTTEGVGMVIRQTSAHWVPDGHLIIAIVAMFDKHTGEWNEAIPC